ncbi:MAG: phosphoadenosine phosphosulfate reductase family protein [Selenomonadaceae bacterium]|nr:phosphoadenosine phosphosulfate reductase family protein [Selenomonadaceae bacterium]
MELKYTKEDLKRLQSLPLYEKINLSKLRITEWYEHWQGKVCVSYSGGKDSTVLLKLVRELYPDVPAVYVDTRLDFPEVREHVKNTDNVIWLKPEMNFRKVIDTYGFCYPSKPCALHIDAARRNVPYALQIFEGKKKDGTPQNINEKFKRWKWLIDVDVKISAKCCEVMKERPLNKFQKENGVYPFIGILAYESQRRQMAWYMNGCNNFTNSKRANSKPIAFWTEQDILRYIVDNAVVIPTVYGSIIADKSGKLSTTGESRTGCIFCPIGAHLQKPNKFQRMKETHPQLYKYCMNELGLDEFLIKVGVPH